MILIILITKIFYIGAKGREEPQEITFDFLLQEIPRAKTRLPEDIQDIVTQFKLFKPGELVLRTQNPTGTDYLKALIEQKVGSCQHRSIAFTYLMSQKHPHIPVRMIENDCHMFVEVKQGNDWIRCDLGGYPV